jgi:hypothetical protein
MPAAGSTTSAATASGFPSEFATLLPASTGVVPAAPFSMPVSPAAASEVLSQAAGPLANQAMALMTETGGASTLTFVIAGKVVAPGKAVATAAPASSSEHEPVRPHGISREEFEQAAAFVAALMQTLLPAAAPASEAAPTGADAVGAVSPEATDPVADPVQVSTQGSPWQPTSLALPNGRAFPTNLPDQAKPALGAGRSAPAQFPVSAPTTDEVLPEQAAMPLILPNGRDFPTEVPDQAKPSLGANRSVPSKLPEQARPMAAASSPVSSEPVSGVELPVVAPVAANTEAVVAPPEPIAAAPEPNVPAFTVAADGAIELKLNLSSSGEDGWQPDNQPGPVLEVSAELELPGQAIIRVEAMMPETHGFSEAPRPVNFAGSHVAEKLTENLPAEGRERNFVFTEDKQVRTASSGSGIAVAKTENKMSAAPTEEIRHTRNPETLSALPHRVDFQVVQSPAERITVAPTEPAGQNFAERAVATVTGLAEAQFTASMQKAGSVQLRLKFGGEDLSVRVELRDGAVHTDFRTDSPALREALAKEWQAVAAASPGHLQRFLDPVFSPASVSASTDTGSQQQAAHRQSPQQQAQEHAAQRQDAWHSQSPFSRRSALSENFVPEPATPRVPVLLPTSLRLSVLA